GLFSALPDVSYDRQLTPGRDRPRSPRINMAKRVSVLDSHGVNKKPSPSRVRVSVRLRPFMEKEEDQACVRGLDAQSLEIVNYRNQLETMQYHFDAFYGEKATQREIYTSSVCPILPHLLVGQNASVFAYGPTGAGKTHTMLGNPQQPGIIPRAVRDLLQMTRGKNGTPEEENWTFTITMSYVEIYQEKVMDLLEPKNKDLPIREDKGHNILIPGVTQKTITTFSDFDEHFIPASQNRTVASTKLNDRSSRSHAVLLIKAADRKALPHRPGRLRRQPAQRKNQGIRLKESGAINSSLFTLSKDSLGGSAHSVMIANIAPEKHYYFDTLTALNFAAKSKQVINKPSSLETTQAPVQPTMKRPWDDLENLVPSQHPKKRSLQPQKEVEEKAMAAEARSDIELSDSIVSEGTFRVPLRTRAKARKVLRVQPLQGLNENSIDAGILMMEKKTQVSGKRWEWLSGGSTHLLTVPIMPPPQKTLALVNGGFHVGLCIWRFSLSSYPSHPQKVHDGDENKPSWEMKMQTDLLQNGREQILNLLNTGSIKELKSLKNIGDKKAKRIVGWRELNGPFTNVEDLASMEGMSTKQVDSFLKANILCIVAS
ncbi:unnamed protein product, partial [Ranitomeya imitator]